MNQMYKAVIRLRSSVLVFLTHQMALPILKLVRESELFPYSLANLALMQRGTLGKDLAEFIDHNELELLPFYARHDIKHILLDYPTTDEGEGSLQCFMLGNGHISFPVLATVIYCFITMPEHWRLFSKAFKRGKNATNLEHWNWFALLPMETIILKQQINHHKIKI